MNMYMNNMMTRSDATTTCSGRSTTTTSTNNKSPAPPRGVVVLMTNSRHPRRLGAPSAVIMALLLLVLYRIRTEEHIVLSEFRGGSRNHGPTNTNTNTTATGTMMILRQQNNIYNVSGDADPKDNHHHHHPQIYFGRINASNITIFPFENNASQPERWTSQQVLKRLQEKKKHDKASATGDNDEADDDHDDNVDFWMNDSMPEPQGEDVEIYNIDAWRKLRSLLFGYNTSSSTANSTASSKQEEGVTTTTICANGGSVTAGAGSIMPHQRWDHQWVKMLQEHKTKTNTAAVNHNGRSSTNTNTNSNPQPIRKQMEIINRGHGQRDSFHTALLMPTFIPPNVDILVWEFSVNDSTQNECTKINNMLVQYLNQLKWQFETFYKRRDPPLVILAHVWSVPLSIVDDGADSRKKISDPVFTCHDRLAAQYDFVVGTVNLASYVSHRFQDWSVEDWKEHLLVTGDPVHPSEFGHQLLAYLLWDLVANGDQRTVIARTTTQLHDAPPKLNFSACDTTTIDPATARIQKLLSEQPSLASWSAETPRNEQPEHQSAGGMLYPSVSFFSSNNATDRILLRSRKINETALHQSSSASASNTSSMMRGKAAASRVDRKYSFMLPCCDSKERLSFDLTGTSTTTKRPATDENENDEKVGDAGLQFSAIQVFSGDEYSTIPDPSHYLQVELIRSSSNAATIATSTTILGANASWVLPQHRISSKNKKVRKNDLDACQVGRAMTRTWLLLPTTTKNSSNSSSSRVSVSRLDVCNRAPSCPRNYTLAHLSLL